MHPLKTLPVSMSTVLFYLSHLSQEGEVREGSLNPYLVEVNQMHQDAGFRRPTLGHYVDLLRKGFANVEAQETSSTPVRMPLPPAVVHDILTLGLASRDNETLRQASCIVLCYFWFNRADTGVLLRRSHVSFDKRGVSINAQGKTVVKNRSCPVFRRHAPDFDPEDKVCRLLRRWHDTSAPWQHSNSLYWSLSRVQKGKELNDFQRNPLDIEILSNLRFGSLEIRDTSVTMVTNHSQKTVLTEDYLDSYTDIN
jgi:hypothetical protein